MQQKKLCEDLMQARCFITLIFSILLSLSGHAAPTQKSQPEWTPSLAADEPPAKKPWEDGATLALNSTNGDSTVLADAVLKLEKITDTSTANGFQRQIWGPGLYLHKSTDTMNPINDRGFNFSYGGLWIDDGSTGGARRSWGWNVDAKVGKKLSSDSSSGTKEWFDKNATRLTAAGQYVYVPSVGILDPNNIKPHLYHFYTATARLYSDQISGGLGTSGRLNGIDINLRGDFAPWGLNPLPLTGTSLSAVPTVGMWCQYQHDISTSGGRLKENRPLYGIRLQFQFAQLDNEGIVPSIALERTIGSDLLTGRARSGVSKLTLTIKY